MRITFFGTFRVTLAERLLSFPTNKVAALFAYLALNNHAPQPRAMLGTLLWGNYDDRRAGANLRNALSSLHHFLRTAAQEQEAAIELETTRHWVQLHLPTDQHWVDVYDAERLWQHCKCLGRDSWTQDGGCVAALTEMVALYRGAFLADMILPDSPEFRSWLFQEQERFHRRVLKALDTLIAHHLLGARYEQVAAYARHQLTLEPWRESGHRALMRALAGQGEYEAALLQFERCKQLLQEELGIGPSKEMLTLVGQITQEREHLGAARPATEQGVVPLAYPLPAPTTPFIGREALIAQVEEVLGERTYRLLTLIGIGGSGKTRLALHLAWKLAEQLPARFPDGILFVPMATVEGGDQVIPTIARALGLRLTSQESMLTQLCRYLHRKSLLLILDNLEQLLGEDDVIPTLLTLLEQAPQLVLLLTSRQALEVRAESLFHLEGLATPDAVQLFVQQARRLNRRFAYPEQTQPVARICQLLGGLPLGLELAAAQSQWMSCSEIARNISESLDLLTDAGSDLPPRQQSLRATFDHSWRLLIPEQQCLLAQCTVFRDGFTEAAASVVMGQSYRQLRALVSHSLMNWDGRRYRMHPIIQEFAREHFLAKGEERQILHERHSHYYLALLEELAQRLGTRDTQQVLAQLHPELANIQHAWMWAVRREELPRIRGSLRALHQLHWHLHQQREGEQLFLRAIPYLHPMPEADEARWLAWAQVLLWRAIFLGELNDYPAARALAEQAQSVPKDDATRMLFHRVLGEIGRKQTQYDEALHHLEEMLSSAKGRGDVESIAWARREMGVVFLVQSRYAEAQEAIEEALALHRRGENIAEIAQSTQALGYYHLLRDNLQEAAQLFREALAYNDILGNRVVQGQLQSDLGLVYSRQGEFEQAIATHETRLAHAREYSSQREEGIILLHLARDYGRLGQVEQSSIFARQGLEVVRPLGHLWFESLLLLNLALLAHQQGENLAAMAHCQAAIDLARQIKSQSTEATALTILGHAQTEQGDGGAAATSYQEAIRIRQALGENHLAMEARAGLARLAMAEGRVADAHHQVEMILEHLHQGILNGMEEPLRVYLTCYQTLATTDPARAARVGGEMEELLRRRAYRIANKEWRHSFLYQIPAHREILHLFPEMLDAESSPQMHRL